MIRVVVVLAVVVAALVVAYLAQRRRPEAPTNPRHADAPVQVDRRDFPRPDAPWLVAVFSSATCASCAQVRDTVKALCSDAVEVFDAEVSEAAALHERYHIEAVPMTLLIDDVGVVRRSFIGPVSATHLWGAMAELRAPGSIPDGCAAVPPPPAPQDGPVSPSSET